MDFTHEKLKTWIPNQINITESEYLKKFECDKCCSYLQEMKKAFPKNKHLNQKISDDLFFYNYYWIMECSKDNHYGLTETIYSLMKTFQLDMEFYKIPDALRPIAHEISMDNLLKLCTYHGLWLHHYYHVMRESYHCYMHSWDDMHQSDHVHAKNTLSYLIYLLLTCPKRKELNQEIRDFSLCPPFQKGAVSGYKYQKAKQRYNQSKDVYVSI